MASRVAKLLPLLNCALLSGMLAAFYYANVRRRAYGALSYLIPQTPVSMGSCHLHGNELRVAKEIEHVSPSVLTYGEYLAFLDAASIACIQCEDHQRGCIVGRT